MTAKTKKDLRGLVLPQLEHDIREMQEPKFRASQVFSWVHQKNVSSFEEMKNLSKELRDKLASLYAITPLKPMNISSSTDGTKKYLFELEDGYRIESVLLDDEGRKTICLSSQVGCKMGCAYCATGHMKFRRNLTAGEIVSQVIQIEKDEGRISNLVYMGMGEPMDNYDNVLKSIAILHDPKGKNISMRKITISTCGVVPGIERLANEYLPLTLAISLNASIDPIRSKLMPVNNKYPLTELIAAVKDYINKTKSRVTFEYVLLEGVNDTRQDARGIVKLIRGMMANINLIAYNPSSSSTFRFPSNKTIKDFRWVLEDAGLEVTQRFKRGQDINAACGQLVASNVHKTERVKDKKST